MPPLGLFQTSKNEAEFAKPESFLGLSVLAKRWRKRPYFGWKEDVRNTDYV